MLFLVAGAGQADPVGGRVETWHTASVCSLCQQTLSSMPCAYNLGNHSPEPILATFGKFYQVLGEEVKKQMNPASGEESTKQLPWSLHKMRVMTFMRSWQLYFKAKQHCQNFPIFFNH